MINNRNIAFDTLFILAYIGVSTAMAVAAATLMAFHVYDVEFTTLHWSALAFNAVGIILLPLAPRLYQQAMGYPFSWSSNDALGGSA